jgi:hypothetical protein
MMGRSDFVPASHCDRPVAINDFAGSFAVLAISRRT